MGLGDHTIGGGGLGNREPGSCMYSHVKILAQKSANIQIIQLSLSDGDGERVRQRERERERARYKCFYMIP